jgi:hypothetical protein
VVIGDDYTAEVKSENGTKVKTDQIAFSRDAIKAIKNATSSRKSPSNSTIYFSGNSQDSKEKASAAMENVGKNGSEVLAIKSCILPAILQYIAIVFWNFKNNKYIL